MPENKVNPRIAELALKWSTRQLTPEEQAELDAWYAAFDDTLLEGSSPESADQLRQRIYSVLLEKAGISVPEPQAEIYEWPEPSRRLWPRYVAAAAILLLISATWLLLRSRNDLPIAQSQSHDVPPGGNKAILTLAGGQEIVLSDAQNGQLARQQGAAIEKTADGAIRYNAGSDTGQNRAGGNIASMVFNTVTTPRGGQYAVTLSDGTKVVLNASSSIKYPAVFTGDNRTVQLTGEAWFDVAKDKQHPFLVSTPKQDLEVLGTEFNINAYYDEPGTKTTLLAGSVKIMDHTHQRSGILKPGQQSNLDDSNLSFTEADTEEAIAWKNGYFMFESEDISSIMRKVARWYDVDIVYEGPRPADQFNGTVQRLVSVSQVLKKLELTNKVHFTIEGRTIKVRR
jgi:transmembrane sensor